MPLIENGRAIDDPWTHVGDDQDLAPGVPAIVSLDRWRRERVSLIVRNTPIGVRLGAGDAPEEIAADLHRFDVVALDFPTFRDGRAYSSARLLRERFGYEGEIRAVGNVLRDQFAFMARCGFDAVEAEKPEDAADWGVASGEITVVYQAAADGRRPVSRSRRQTADLGVS